MANPTPYTVSYNFSSFQANSPATPLPAPKVDNEFANLATSNASIISSLADLRRSDGALNNGIVTFDSLEPGLQFTIDPTNGQAVAAAVAVAQAAATAATGSSTVAGAKATAAAASAVAAAASAASVDLTLFLAKANNLAGLGSNDTALANIGAAKSDGSNLVGRLAPVTGINVTDWNLAKLNGGYFGSSGAANAPDGNPYLTHVIAFDAFNVTQIAYGVGLASISTSAVQIYRRHSYNNSGVITWQPWNSASPIPVGTSIWVNSNSAPPGFLKENGALISRTAYPALWNYANASGNIVSEASWSAGNTGAFSTGDMSATFRLMDSRGEFIRGYDDGRGVDSGRAIGTLQADALKDHTHNVLQASSSGNQKPNGTGTAPLDTNTTVASGDVTGGGATETRPRNIAKLACIKF